MLRIMLIFIMSILPVVVQASDWHNSTDKGAIKATTLSLDGSTELSVLCFPGEDFGFIIRSPEFREAEDTFLASLEHFYVNLGTDNDYVTLEPTGIGNTFPNGNYVNFIFSLNEENEKNVAKFINQLRNSTEPIKFRVMRGYKDEYSQSQVQDVFLGSFSHKGSKKAIDVPVSNCFNRR